VPRIDAEWPGLRKWKIWWLGEMMRRDAMASWRDGRMMMRP
jgi:hypothetical protein